MIDPRHITLIQQSFLAVLPITDRAARCFYDRLFTIAPDTRSLFTGDMTVQGRKLFMTLSAVVDGLDHLDTVVPVARELAIRHIGYGAQLRHYDAVGVALLDMLRHELGDRCDADTEAAWAAAYTLIADVMTEAVRQAA